MKVTLLFPGDHVPAPITYGDTVFDDLGLPAVFDAAADGDRFVADAVRSAITCAVPDPTVISHRHAVLADCCAHPDLVREVYAIATAATTVRRWSGSHRRGAGGTLVLALPPFAEELHLLRRLRTLLHRQGAHLGSAGWSDVVATTALFDDTYLDTVHARLEALRFDHGIEFDAGLGTGNTIADIVLREPPRARRARLGFTRTGNTFEAIDDGAINTDPVMELKDHALDALARVVSAAADELHRFFTRLREQTAFYLGCLTLREHLDRAGIAYCVPRACPTGTPRLHCRGLRDVTLSLAAAHAKVPGNGANRSAVTGNDLDADDRTLLVVTGANNGGKSTFLRSLGAAQLMMQAGMFVLADEFTADVRDGVFTHFVGDEDRTLSYGKLVDELVRMNTVIDRIGPHGLLLCNEAFASTSERDATRISEPLLQALTEAGVKVVSVTHLYDYAHTRYAGGYPGDLFLRAERAADGDRTHRIVPGAPESGGHGGDLFAQIFGQPPDPLAPPDADCSAP